MSKNPQWEALLQRATSKAQAQVQSQLADAVAQAMRETLESGEAEVYSSTPPIDTESLMASILADPRLAQIIKQDVNDVAAKVLDKLPRARVTRLISPTGATKEFDHAHENFEELCYQINLGLNVALIGEAGSGKTFGAFQCAEALGLTPYFQPFNGMMSTSSLVGYRDPHGNYKATPLYDAYTKGGLVILDEYDRGNSDVTIMLNGLLEGSRFTFADGVLVDKHPDFRVVACQNTTGHGSSKAYASAQRQDGSSLTRFSRIIWNIDTTLEDKVALAQALPYIDKRFSEADSNRYHAIMEVKKGIVAVQKIRAKAKDLGYDHLLISPRQTIHTTKLVATGRHSIKKALEYSILNGLASDVVKRLMEGVEL